MAAEVKCWSRNAAKVNGNTKETAQIIFIIKESDH